jgi:hypothetical protein
MKSHLPPTTGSTQKAPLSFPGSDCLITQSVERTAGVSTLRQKFEGGTTSEVGAGSALEETDVELGVEEDKDASAGSALIETELLGKVSVANELSIEELGVWLTETETVEDELSLMTGTFPAVTVTVTVATVTVTYTVATYTVLTGMGG